MSSSAGLENIARPERRLAKFEIWKNIPSYNVFMRMNPFDRGRVIKAFREEVAARKAMGEIATIHKEDLPVRFTFTRLLGKGSRRYDNDNWATASKIITDCFVSLGYLPEDTDDIVLPYDVGAPEINRAKPCGGVRVWLFSNAKKASVDERMANITGPTPLRVLANGLGITPPKEVDEPDVCPHCGGKL